MRALETPLGWEGMIKRYLKRTFYPDTRRADFADRGPFTEGDYRFFATGVRRLNQFFTKERGSLPRNYFHQKDLRSGYILYFLPVNALKVATMLQAMPSILQKKEVRILDLGAGPGTGMIGFLLSLSHIMRRQKSGVVRLRWTLVDQNGEILKDAKRLHEAAISQLREEHAGWEIDSSVQTIVADLTRFFHLSEPVDLILAVNLLEELPPSRRVPLFQTLLKRGLKPEGRILIMEPALQRTTRGLMEFHDRIIKQGVGFVHAPCLHQAACPMLAANRRDWCHTTLEWDRPSWIEKIDRLVGIRKDYLKCSYLVLGSVPPRAPSPETWRVVSGHLNSKGKSELLLCGEAALPKLRRLVRLDRHRTPAKDAFDEVQRGDLLKISNQASPISFNPMDQGRV